MKNKVLQFPQPPGHAEVPTDEPVIFSLGDQRFAIQWIVSEVNRKLAEVIPIQKKRTRAAARLRADRNDRSSSSEALTL